MTASHTFYLQRTTQKPTCHPPTLVTEAGDAMFSVSKNRMVERVIRKSANFEAANVGNLRIQEGDESSRLAEVENYSVNHP